MPDTIIAATQRICERCPAAFPIGKGNKRRLCADCKWESEKQSQYRWRAKSSLWKARKKADLPKDNARRRARYAADETYRAARIQDRRNYYALKPDQAKDARRRREALLKGARVERVSFREMYERDGGICQICLMPVSYQEASQDHIEPLSKGGLHCLANVQTAHKRCNSKKGARENFLILET